MEQESDQEEHNLIKQEEEDDAALQDSVNKEARESVMEKAETSSCELEQTAKKRNARHSQLIVLSNAICSSCNLEKDSCIIVTTQCRHQVCIDCIEQKITLAIQQKLENHEKISVDLVLCKSAEWCGKIIPLDNLLPLLNLSEQDHAEDIERIMELYEPSQCCKGEDNYLFVD